jgi:hypothetical protein
VQLRGISIKTTSKILGSLKTKIPEDLARIIDPIHVLKFGID